MDHIASGTTLDGVKNFMLKGGGKTLQAFIKHPGVKPDLPAAMISFAWCTGLIGLQDHHRQSQDLQISKQPLKRRLHLLAGKGIAQPSTLSINQPKSLQSIGDG